MTENETCGVDLADPPDYCPCLLPRGHAHLHRCKHFITNPAEGVSS